MTRQTILASRPAAMVLALTLVAGLTAPFLMLPRAMATTATLACEVGNHNGCTELSPTPPEDTASVPPNIVLMLDDSGSMAWDYMPDAAFLSDTSDNGKRSSDVNGAYYNPTKTYDPPPKADGTLYPDSPGLTDAYADGFLDTTDEVDVTGYANNPPDGSDGFSYHSSLATDIITKIYPAPITSCAGTGYSPDPSDPTMCIRPNDPATLKCNPGDGSPKPSHSNQCRHIESGGESGPVTTWYNPTLGCASGSTLSGTVCVWPPRPVTYNCASGGGLYKGQCVSLKYVNVFTYNVQTSAGHYTQRFVAAGSDCDHIYNASYKSRCVNEDDTTGASAPAGVAAGKNIANWFSYYRTRILLAKTGLMKAFSTLKPKFRFGYGSIDGGTQQWCGYYYCGNNNYQNMPTADRYGYTDTYNGGGTNYISEVQPFGDGSLSTDQKTAFWNWLAKAKADGGTPLRQALNAVGKYYQTDQPWTTMSSDPGYSSGSGTKFACRASFAILTTDGFWNGVDPGTGNVANTDGHEYTGVGGKKAKYQAKDPFKGGSAVTVDSGGDPTTTAATSLADVATYYWENDLQSGPGFDDEVPTSPEDPAFWQHMTTYTVGMGFDPVDIKGTDTAGNPVTVPEIFAWARTVDAGTAPATPNITGFGWPTPFANSKDNIADLVHAAVNGHGGFGSAKDPDQLAAFFVKTFADIGARTTTSAASAVNASVVTAGALSFATSYNTGDWSGTLAAVTLAADGTIDTTATPQWVAGPQLDSAYHNANYTKRVVFTDAYKLTVSGGVVTARTYDSSFQLTAANSAKLDGDEIAGLQTPALPAAAGSLDTLNNRINYLLGDNEYEATVYRARNTLLGAIVHSQPVYVSYPASGYFNNWPADAPEAKSDAQSYDTFMSDYANRPGTLYVAANDGMLHAFAAPAPKDCTPGPCDYGDGGKELWAFVPRAVYANLGNLTSLTDFSYRPTVDATPVTRDIYFTGGTYDKKWQTILVGGVGLGGRGVYALDITGTKTATAASPDLAPTSIMWEFDSDMTMTSGCTANYGTCRSSDLGYTVSQPNIGRVAYDNKWIVLVPNGYFPDCTTPDTPTDNTLPDTSPNSCASIAAQAPKDSSGKPYSALFVLDAQSGDVIAELKTPTDIAGVTSYGLATPVMGAYDGGQLDQVAFAGDVEGNLWRFDLSSADGPTKWTVTLAYKGVSDPTTKEQGLQPITSMPRLFPDPASNRFMVVFGTGRYLGIGDNVTNKDASGDYLVQAVYGVRDQGSSATSATAYTQSDLVQQYLSESLVTSGTFTGATVRCITGKVDDSCDPGPGSTSSPPNPVPDAAKTKLGGWFFNLKTSVSGVQNDVGERVVVTPGAIFSSNTVVVQTLITGGNSDDPCNPSTKGSVLFVNVSNGGPGTGVSSLGGYPAAGARVEHARTSGTLPIVSALGGGKVYVPGMKLTGATTDAPITGDLPIWRRRSWNEIKQNQ